MSSDKERSLKEEKIIFEKDEDEQSSEANEEEQSLNNNRFSVGISIFPKENNELDLNNVEVQVAERPRLAVSHMLSKAFINKEKKSLVDDDRDDDYQMFSYVDENGLKCKFILKF